MREYTSASEIVWSLIKNLSELVIIMGRYLGIYAKDSLDELLLISHRSSSYKGKSREIERNAVMKYIEMEDKEVGYYEAEIYEKDIEKKRKEIERSEHDASSPNGDNFPYIRGHSNPY